MTGNIPTELGKVDGLQYLYVRRASPPVLRGGLCCREAAVAAAAAAKGDAE